MKKLFLCLAGAAAALTLNAKVWRVNYDENAKADFKTIAAACATTLVSDGDTLYMEPGLHNGSSTDNTISRPLTILGPGWGFEANEGALSYYPMALFSNDIQVYVSNVTIKGLRIKGRIYVNGNTNAEENFVFERNYCSCVYAFRLKNNVVVRNNIMSYLSIGASIDNVVVENNIFLVANSYNHTYYVEMGATSDKNLYNIFRFNTIICTTSYKSLVLNAQTVCTDNIIIAQNSTYKNFFDWNTTAENLQFKNNVMSISQEEYEADLVAVSPVGYANYPDNIWAGATIENTFVNEIGTIGVDEAMKYMLLPTSPAKNAATDGTDCGAFGGEHPFVLYGRPEGIPYIYDVEVPAYPTDNKLNISFKVAGQNE